MREIEIDGHRYYEDDRGRFPAVGTILRATEAPKVGLDIWKSRVGEEAADLKMHLSAARGRRMEEAIEAALVHGCPDEDVCCLDAFFASALTEVAKIAANAEDMEFQCTVVHEIDRYAGTLDIRYRSKQDGRRKVDDWKSYAGQDANGKFRTKSRAQMADALCQVAAYCDAEAWRTGERPDGRVILCIPTRPARVFDVSEADLAEWRRRNRMWQEGVRAA